MGSKGRIDIQGIVFIVIFLLTVIFFSTQMFKERVVHERAEPIQVYFCPQDDCEGAFVNLLSSAQTSLDCALYDLDLESVIDVFREKSEQDRFNVRLLVDDTNKDSVDDLTFVRFDTSAQLSHNKFCVIDESIVWTGSMNPTENGVSKNNNNVVVIRSDFLAKNYLRELDELYNRQFGAGAAVEFSLIQYGDTLIENYFCPEDACQSHVIDVIDSAKESIYFMTYSFTDDEIGEAIYDSDVPIKGGVFDTLQVHANGQFSEYARLKTISKLDSNPYAMHHKVFIIDESIVVTGSYNPSRNGNVRNDENILIIHDPSIAALYVSEFKQLYQQGN